ncbi:hypothetical protein [Acidicapsa ligni]|uniref:hypothetical protein n=1 Tax=Acidicapsa ligni TaxID=542300 RepID=UPI0021DFCEFC|nr:hypothetical protein [Acidicapsa ligni]
MYAILYIRPDQDQPATACPGILGPRGWHCFGTYGSNGASLYVSPQPLTSEIFFSSSWNGFTGPAIQASFENGDTSGRFGVAKTIARVFPAYKNFVQAVIAEGLQPGSEFPFGPYPKDKLTYLNKERVEYQTPPLTEGLGTHSRLQSNADPISGVAILIAPTPDLLSVFIRLSPDAVHLTPTIIQQAEREAGYTAQRR